MLRPQAPRIDDFVAKLAAMHDTMFIDSTRILMETMAGRTRLHVEAKIVGSDGVA